jgi:predicted transcriptional regulator
VWGGEALLDNTLELAENKLLLLYVLYEIKLPVSNNQLTQIILENNFINYFTLQQYITELNSSKFIEYTDKDGKQRLVITEKGVKVLSMFKNRISVSKIDSIDEYLLNHLPGIKKEITVNADYTIVKNNNFIVNMTVVENDLLIMDLKINVPSKKHAEDLCKKWKENSSHIYDNIMKSLFDS